MFPLIKITQIFDGYYMVIVERDVAALVALAYLALFGLIPYLANKSQPVPNWR